jgi:hypothetical protein
MDLFLHEIAACLVQFRGGAIWKKIEEKSFFPRKFPHAIFDGHVACNGGAIFFKFIQKFALGLRAVLFHFPFSGTQSTHHFP